MTTTTGTFSLNRIARSEEHTSELQSHVNLVCRLLLEKKKHEMPGRRLAGQALPIPQPGHLQLGDDLVHLPLDRLHAYQLVQFCQRGLTPGSLGVAAEP